MDTTASPRPTQDHPQVHDAPIIQIQRPKPASWSPPGHPSTRRQSIVVRWLEEDIRRGSVPLSLGPIPSSSLLRQSSSDIEGKATREGETTDNVYGVKLLALASALALTGFLLFLDVSILSSVSYFAFAACCELSVRKAGREFTKLESWETAKEK